MSLRAFQENPCGSLKNQPVQSNKQSERTKTRELKCLPLEKRIFIILFLAKSTPATLFWVNTPTEKVTKGKWENFCSEIGRLKLKIK